jgi:hypothetical protein
MEKKLLPIEPKYIRSKQGKAMGVYLDIDTYKAVLEEVRKLEGDLFGKKNKKQKKASTPSTL